jgi:hypothetical protein
MVELLGDPGFLDGCRIRTAGYFDVGEGARLFLSDEDLRRFNTFNAIAVRVPLVEDGTTARVAAPLGSAAIVKTLVMIDGTYRRGGETDDTRIDDVTALAPYGKPVAPP